MDEAANLFYWRVLGLKTVLQFPEGLGAAGS